MNRPLFSLTAKALFAGAFACCLATTAGATTYYWKGGSTWANYGTLSNWSTESDQGADADVLPGASDSFPTITSQKCYFDLGGQVWEIGTYSPGSGHRYYFTNGTFRITNYSEPKGEQTHIYEGGVVTCSSGISLCLGCWDANPLNETVHAGGILDYSPATSINAHNWNLTVEADGTARLCQKWSDGLGRTHAIVNAGTLDLSNGFNACQNSASVKFNFTHNAGTLILGGAFSNTGYANELTLSLAGGTLALRSGASFSATSVSVPDHAMVEMEILANTSVDLTPISFGAGATIAKTGAGDFAFMPGNMPDALTVNAGGLALATANTSYDLSSVTFAAGTKVKIGATGVTLSNWGASLSSATFAVADGYIPANGATVLTIADATLLAQAQAGLNASLAGTGMTVATSGNSLVRSEERRVGKECRSRWSPYH